MSLVSYPVATPYTDDAISDSLFVLRQLREVHIQIDEEMRRDGVRQPGAGVPVLVPPEVLDTVILRLELAKGERDRTAGLRIPMCSALIGAGAAAIIVGMSWLLTVSK